MEIIAMLALMIHWFIHVENKDYSITTEGLTKYDKDASSEDDNEDSI